MAEEQLVFDWDRVSPPKPELRELWTPDDIFAGVLRDGSGTLRQFAEDNRIEWKSAKIQTRDLGEYFSMWANTQPYGGLLVIGLEKDGTATGCQEVGLQ